MLATAQNLTKLSILGVEALLIARFIVLALGASDILPIIIAENNKLIYLSNLLIFPFVPIFPGASVKGGQTLEFVTLFAIFAYAFLGFVILQMLDHKQSKM